MARDWPDKGGQSLTSADTCRHNAVVHTQRVSREVEMEDCEGAVEREREVGKRNL